MLNVRLDRKPMQIIVLTLMEGVKILVAIWVGTILFRISVLIEKDNPQVKGQHLKYIKTHGKYIFGLVMTTTIIFILTCWIFLELHGFKKNYKNLWKWRSESEMRLERLEGK